MIDDNADEERALLRREGSVAFVTLNRPERLNAMDRRSLESFAGVLDHLEADPEVQAIVVAGAGRAFSSGLDLKEQTALRPRGEFQRREILDRALREALDGDVALEAIGTADNAQFLDIAGREGRRAELRWRD